MHIRKCKYINPHIWNVNPKSNNEFLSKISLDCFHIEAMFLNPSCRLSMRNMARSSGAAIAAENYGRHGM
jgi:hypothetical protein